MMFIDALGWSDFGRIDPPSTIQMVVLFFLALVFMPVAMRLFSHLFRFAFIVTAVVAPVYIMLPVLQ
jgi:hypothetical protein